MTKTAVLFTDTHWMTSAANMLYFEYLSNFYRGKKVGLVYDKTSSHCSKAVNNYVKYWNDNPDNTCTCVIECVDPCLTNVYQPPNIMYNKPCNALTRTKYNESISTQLVNVCKTIDEFNQKHHQSKQMFKSFGQIAV